MSASPHHVLLSSVHPSSPCTTFFCLSRLHVFLHSVSKHSLFTSLFCLSSFLVTSLFCLSFTSTHVILSSVYHSFAMYYFLLSINLPCVQLSSIFPPAVLLSSVFLHYLYYFLLSIAHTYVYFFCCPLYTSAICLPMHYFLIQPNIHVSLHCILVHSIELRF